MMIQPQTEGVMAGVEVRRFDEPDDTWEFGDRGRSEILNVGGVMVVRSILQPGWSWMEDIKPQAEGLENCPLHHREYVVSGRIRYEVVETGEVVEADAGSYLDIQPGHLASVVGDEPAVLVDFDEDWGEG
ncbi:MAG TPA: hypothetical protein VM253_02935 [Candidatus Limnocylindrales bacterium]|jgi:hypothetical protein|nr:hypothetical protein [Candidatus Limnocylindrales bacterium]